MIARVPHLIDVSRTRPTSRRELTMRVDELAPVTRAPRRRQARVGRGIGGKGGKTAGRGTKGQQRPQHGRPRLRRWPDAAQAARPEAEGVQQPVPRRVPGRQPHTLGELATRPTITPEVLVANGVVRKKCVRQGARPRRDHSTRSTVTATRSRRLLKRPSRLQAVRSR